MATYKGKTSAVAMSATEAYNRLTDPATFRTLLESAPDDMRAKMGEIEFNDDAIVINTPQMGAVTMKVVERQEGRSVKFNAEGSPVPLTMSMQFTPTGDNESTVGAVIDVEIPMMLRAMIGSHMQQAADKFGEMLVMVLNSPMSPATEA